MNILQQTQKALLKQTFDTVLMNPPFGTKSQEKADSRFLQEAIKLTSNAIYSMHKTSTRAFLQKFAVEHDLKCEVIAEMKFKVPNMYKFHKQKVKYIAVDIIRFQKQKVA